MDIFCIRGGTPLHGRIALHGAKNAALPLLAATLATGARCELLDCPDISDVTAACAILRHLGCAVEQHGGIVAVDAGSACRSDIPAELMRKMRAAVLFLGPLLARFGTAELDQNRVVTPDYSFFSDRFGKFSEYLDPLFDRGKVALDVFPVRVQRELEIILEAVQFAEPRQHRSGVLRPEDDAIHCVRTEAHAADRSRVERIGNEYVSFPEAVKEPRGVEGGNVRPTAGADDHTI